MLFRLKKSKVSGLLLKIDLVGDPTEWFFIFLTLILGIAPAGLSKFQNFVMRGLRAAMRANSWLDRLFGTSVWKKDF